MSIRRIIGWLSEEDRRRYVETYARVQLVLGGSPLIGSVEEAQRICAEDFALFRELREKHEIPEDEGVDFSLYDGAILEADSE